MPNTKIREVWNHFEKRGGSNCCKLCDQMYAKNTSNSSFAYHRNKIHNMEINLVVKQNSSRQQGDILSLLNKHRKLTDTEEKKLDNSVNFIFHDMRAMPMRPFAAVDGEEF